MPCNNSHFAEIIYRQAERYGERTELSYQDDKSGRWINVSWNAFAEKARLASQAMIEYGIGVQENIGIYAQNCPEYFYAAFGAFGIRAVETPMYATSSPEQVANIICDARIRLLFVGEQLQYNNVLKAREETDGILQQLIIFDKSVVKHPDDKTSLYFDEFIRLGDNAHAETTAKIRRNEATGDDVGLLVYTSGTTGGSKGVMLSHNSLLEMVRIHDMRLPQLNDRDVSLCFLPLAHIFENGWSCICISQGIRIAINRDPQRLLQTLAEIRPTLLCNVPRFWEKIYAGVNEKINNSPALARRILLHALRTGRRYVLDYRNKGIKAPAGLACSFFLYNRTVFFLLKKIVGLDKGRAFPVAGAPLADHITEFLLSVNLPILYGYGLSETSATVCFFPNKNFIVGSIGKVMPGLEVRIDEANSEILVKGPTVMSGYYNRPDDTAQAFTSDGFFRTGDAGRLEGDTLFFVERIKDLFKTSYGKYIAPQAIESSMNGNPYIGRCIAVGDNCKFVSALIAPDFDALEGYARKRGVVFANRRELIQQDEIVRFYQSIVEECQKEFAPYEKIKRFTLIAEPLTMETGLITDTLKLRRAAISRCYAAEIAAMYE